ncbi:hypothetical protein BV25DRAFT_1824772 [Artomyces pyxidatus]|uniref:Uncharacterized protein n=1 Tax=Artomyces pyxidatus TaxID=48021 RepID=A0ACB8T3Z2_9AGAM|nr:hypothetical protein BV25DRAFT_1824772 [Artomyces pyxidatus]
MKLALNLLLAASFLAACARAAVLPDPIHDGNADDAGEQQMLAPLQPENPRLQSAVGLASGHPTPVPAGLEPPLTVPTIVCNCPLGQGQSRERGHYWPAGQERQGVLVGLLPQEREDSYEQQHAAPAPVHNICSIYNSQCRDE